MAGGPSVGFSSYPKTSIPEAKRQHAAAREKLEQGSITISSKNADKLED